MKIITDDLISSVTTDGGELSATNYPIENVLTDYPSQVYIEDGTITPASNITITVNLSANADGIFLFNWLADAIEISTDGGSAYSTPDNDRISDNLYLNQGSEFQTKPIFYPTGATSGNGYKVRLSTSVDRKDTPAKGLNIYQFDVDSGSIGRFEDSTGATINLKDHAGVMVGSHINLAGTWHQVTKIIGDGTGTGAVTLSGSPVDNTITAINNPVKIGIIRAGSIETFANPILGLQRSFQGFGTQTLSTGGSGGFVQGNVSQMFSGKIITTIAESDSFMDLFRALRLKPFPCLVTNGMTTAQKENYNFSLFANFPEVPSISYGGQAGATRNINFRLKEFL